MTGGGAIAKQNRLHVWTWLFNPFHYVAGWQALGAGLALMAATGALAYAGGMRFDGVLDFHEGGAMPRWVPLLDGAVALLPLVLLLWIGGVLTSRSRVRPLDVIGTQALARAPATLMPLAAFLPGWRRVVQQLLDALAGGRVPPVPDAAGLVMLLVFCLVVLAAEVWMVALMYRAYAVSCNVRGGRAAVVFVPALLVAEALSKLILFAVPGQIG